MDDGERNDFYNIPEKSIYNRSRICKEIILLFSVFFLPGIVTQLNGFSRQSFDSFAFNLAVVITSVPQILLLLYVLEIQDTKLAGSLGFSIRPASLVPRTVLTFMGLFLSAYATGFLAAMLQSGSFTPGSPISGSRWTLTHPAIIPFLILSSIAVGYREEIFFRAYLITRLEQLGIPQAAVIGTTVLLFSLGHLYEGVSGVLVAVVSGTFLALVYLRNRNVHQIALAHGLYNFGVLLLSGTGMYFGP